MCKSILESLRENLDNQKISAKELFDLCKTRANAQDDLNAFISTSEYSVANENHQPNVCLDIPVAIKDIFCVKGQKVTCASKMLEQYISPYDSTVYSHIKNSNIPLLGKTNMDEFAMGSSGEYSCFGPSKNPWDINLVPGGSSSGSAISVAANITPFAIGSDTGGSVRQPAAYCGITGFKPTYGSISRHGMIAYASSLDQAGIFARHAIDCAYLFNIINQNCEFDETYANPSLIPIENLKPDDTNKPLAGLEIGKLSTWFKHCDSNIVQSIEQALAQCETLGAKIIDLTPELINPRNDKSLGKALFEQELIEAIISAYYIIANAEASSNLARYDTIRYGTRQTADNLDQLYTLGRELGFGAEVKKRIMIGNFVLSQGYYNQYYNRALLLTNAVSNDFLQCFNHCDAICIPTTPTQAFELGKFENNPVEMYANDLFTVPVNLCGLPAISLPINSHNNLPVGMQLIGSYRQEEKLIKIAHGYQLKTDHHLLSPPNAPDCFFTN